MNDESRKKYFPQLQVIRGVAALLVVFSHTYANKIYYNKIPSLQAEIVFANVGVMGLTLFFVLSGFLITYLLLNEKHYTGTINVKKFYIRRVLRILPLYFLLIFIGHFCLPLFVNSNFEGGNLTKNFWIKSILYLLILPNYVLIIFKPHNPYIDVTWSIGVEEQFYFVWPHFIKRKKSILPVIIVLIFIQLLAEMFTHYAALYKTDSKTIFVLNEVVRFIEWTRAGYFAIGAMTAVLFTKKLYHTNKLISKLTSYSPLLFLIIFIIGIFRYFYLQFLLLAVCYCFFQLYLITKSNSKHNALFAFFEWLGKISYGLYLWHCIIIVFVFKAFQNMNISYQNMAITSFILYVVVIVLTIFISWFSYVLFESYFLKIKKKFSIFVIPKSL